MRGNAQSGRRAAALLSYATAAAVVFSGCGGSSHYANRPRPPATIELGGVINDKQVTVSPANIGGGPVRLIISNQTRQSHTIVLERSGNQGEATRDTVGPVSPLATAQLQQNLTEGQYTVSVGSTPDSIQPATIIVGPSRPSSSSTLQQP